MIAAKSEQGRNFPAILRNRAANDNHRVKEEGASLIRFLAFREGRDLADKLGVTPRHIRNLAAGECETSWWHFILMAREYPEARDLVARWLDLVPRDSVEAERLLQKIQKMVAGMPQEGERE